MLTIDIDQGIYKAKSKVAQNEKKIAWIFLYFLDIAHFEAYFTETFH